MNKQIVAYTYNRMLFSHKKERSSDTLYNLDEPWKHYKWKKLDRKGHVLYGFFYRKYPE